MNEDILTVCSIATYVALNNAKIPKTYPKIGRDFDVEGDFTESCHIQNVAEFPILLTVAKVNRSYSQ
jgi:exosome complex RNA-binding protein Rrp42 (RNase PH superfamily)